MKEEGESSGEAPNGTAGATASGASQPGSSSNSSTSKGSSSSSGMPLLKQEPVEASTTTSSSSSNDGSAADGSSAESSSRYKTEHNSPADQQGGEKAASGTSGSAAATKEEELHSREGAAGVNGTADSKSQPGSSGKSSAHVKEGGHSTEAAAAGSGGAGSSSSGSTGGTIGTTGSSGTTSSGGLTVNIDGDDVKRKLARLFSYWDAHYNPPEAGEAAAAGGESWQGVDALVVLIGRSSGEEEEGKNEQMQMWLTGFQFPETLFVFTRTGEWLVLSSAKKLEHLHQIEHCREGISLHARNNADGSAAGLAAVQAAINRAAAAAGKSEDEAIVGRLQQTGPAQQQGSFAQRVEEVLLSKYAESGRLRYVEEGLVMAMAVHTPVEVESIRGASVVAVAMLKTQVVSRIETVLDNEQQESHAAIAGLAENLLKDAKQLDKLREKYHIDPGEIYLLYSNVQSGNHFDLRASAQPTEENLSQGEGTILVSLGVKYKELCAAVARTYLLNGTQEQKDTYQFTVDVFQKVLSLLQPGTPFASIYTETKKFIEEKRPALADHFVKMCGHCVGLDYRNNALVLNAKNTKAVVERGMTFNISVGFSQLQTSGNHPYAVWIADTVHIPTDEGGPPYVVLTDMLSKVLRHVSYELEDAEEDEAEKETAAAAAEEKKPKKQEEKEEPKKSSSSAKEKQQEKSTSKKTADARGKEKTKKTTSAAATGGGGAISATILNNAESVILRDRLRRRTGAQAAMQQQEAEERDARQRQLRKKKLEQLRLRFDNEGEGAGLERKKKEGKKMEDIRCFRSPDEFPRDLKANKLYVDFKSESLLVPIHGSHIPFHLSTVKNVTCSEAERQSDAAAAGGGGGGGLAGSNSSRRTQFFVLRVNFQVPGSQTLTLKGEENPLPDLSGRPETVFVKELMFKSEDGRHLQTIYRTIKEQLKRVKQKALEDDNAGEVAEQDKLVLNRTGRRVLLKDLMIRPNIAPGMRKLIGSLEAHTNGLRFTVNTRGQMDQVDITYSNIKHAIFQPCERELIVLIHFHLKSAIMVGKKRTQDVQFYTEAGTQTDDLDNRRNRSYHDPDETQDEIRERELKRRLNSEFKRFVTQVEDIAKIEFDLPYRELRFTGVPMKSNVEILPTANCLVHLIEWPPFVLPLEDIELVSFERVAHGLRNFDVVFVFQDYTKPVKRIDLVPIEFLDNLKRWLNELEIVWYEGKQNLNWNAILKQIREDLQGFVEAGGFDMFLGEDGRSGDEGDSEDDDDDEEYEESESESEYNEGSGEEEEDSGKDSSDASSDSDDESLADESDEDEEYNDVSSDEEEGLSWDELEERAKKEDRKRRAEDSDEEEDRRKKKKKK